MIIGVFLFVVHSTLQAAVTDLWAIECAFEQAFQAEFSSAINSYSSAKAIVQALWAISISVEQAILPERDGTALLRELGAMGLNSKQAFSNLLRLVAQQAATRFAALAQDLLRAFRVMRAQLQFAYNGKAPSACVWDLRFSSQVWLASCQTSLFLTVSIHGPVHVG